MEDLVVAKFFDPVLQQQLGYPSPGGKGGSREAPLLPSPMDERRGPRRGGGGRGGPGGRGGRMLGGPGGRPPMGGRGGPGGGRGRGGPGLAK